MYRINIRLNIKTSNKYLKCASNVRWGICTYSVWSLGGSSTFLRKLVSGFSSIFRYPEYGEYCFCQAIEYNAQYYWTDFVISLFTENGEGILFYIIKTETLNGTFVEKWKN